LTKSPENTIFSSKSPEKRSSLRSPEEQKSPKNFAGLKTLIEALLAAIKYASLKLI